MQKKRIIILKTKKEKPSSEIKDLVMSNLKKILYSFGIVPTLIEWIPEKPINKILLVIKTQNEEEIEYIKHKIQSAPLMKKHVLVTDQTIEKKKVKTVELVKE